MKETKEGVVVSWREVVLGLVLRVEGEPGPFSWARACEGTENHR